MKIDAWLVKERLNLPFEVKIKFSLDRIREWYKYWDGLVYVSFSGGKDSTILLHLVRSLYPEVPAVFINTGLEYPEVRKFIKTVRNTVTVRPKISFKKVLERYGYPIISKENAQKIYEIRTTKSDKLRNKRLYGDEKGNGKLPKIWHFLIDAPFPISHKCCDILKKNPVKAYEKRSNRKPIVGTMIEDSTNRRIAYRKKGCNSFESIRPISNPISIWTQKDIWEYIKINDLSYSTIYDKGYKNTGCMFCMFGVQREKNPNRFQRMAQTHPKHYEFCMRTLGIGYVLEYLKVEI